MPGSVLTVICVDKGKNVSPANQHSSSTNDRKQEHRILKIGLIKGQSCRRSERGSLLNSESVAFQLDTSKQGYSPDPSSLWSGPGNETKALPHANKSLGYFIT